MLLRTIVFFHPVLFMTRISAYSTIEPTVCAERISMCTAHEGQRLDLLVV